MHPAEAESLSHALTRSHPVLLAHSQNAPLLQDTDTMMSQQSCGLDLPNDSDAVESNSAPHADQGSVCESVSQSEPRAAGVKPDTLFAVGAAQAPVVLSGDGCESDSKQPAGVVGRNDAVGLAATTMPRTAEMAPMW